MNIKNKQQTNTPTLYADKNTQLIKLMNLLGSRSVLAIALLAVVAGSASAADDKEDDTGWDDAAWYVGGNLGLSTSVIADKRVEESLLADGLTMTSISDDEEDYGYKLFGGYRFGRNFAIEAGIFDLGSFGYKAGTMPEGVREAELEVKGLNVDLVGMLPMTENFSALGRFGVQYATTEGAFSGTGAVVVTVPNTKETESNYKFGFGVQYALNHNLALRGEAERFRIDDTVGHDGDVNLYSVGLVYRFIQQEEKDEVIEPKAEEKAEVIVVPVAVAAAAPVAVIVFEDVHFGFDKSQLSKEAKAILRRNLIVLQENPDASVRIAGYTSAKGTVKYNQLLSERRARAVRAFLIEEGIVQPEGVSIIGYGERRPAEYESEPQIIRSDAAKANMRVLFEIVVKK